MAVATAAEVAAAASPCNTADTRDARERRISESANPKLSKSDKSCVYSKRIK